MKTTLRDTSRNAIAQCEKVITALGFEMTTGGELEWYSILPHNRVRVAHEEAIRQVRKIAKDNPDDFFESSIVLKTDTDIVRDYRMLKQMPAFANAQAPGELLDEYIHKHMKHEHEALTQLMMLNVEKRMKEEGIVCGEAHKEAGEIAVPFTTSEDTVITGKQMEISTGITSPGQLVSWLERLRVIIREESERLGLIADFRTKPPYTYLNEHSRELFHPQPSSSQHIHFGLRSLKDKQQNAFHMDDDVTTQLSNAVNEAGMRLLKGGGQLLANPTEEDYLRMSKMDWCLRAPIVLGTAREDKHMALREIDGAHMDTPVTPHKESRLAGSGTPPAAAVLLPVLMVTDALLTTIGKEQPPKPPWRDRAVNNRPSYLESVAAGITDADCGRVRGMATTPAQLQTRDEGALFKSLDTSSASLSSTSAIARLTPEVFTSLKQLTARILA